MSTDTPTTDTRLPAVVNPATGETIDLATAATNELARVVDEAKDLTNRLTDFRQDVIDEVARRLDTVNSRKELIGDVELETNAPTTETYSVTILETKLRELVDAGELDEAIIDRVITWTKPALPSKRADGREVNKLKKSANAKVLAAVAEARTVSPNKRTLKITRAGG